MLARIREEAQKEIFEEQVGMNEVEEEEKTLMQENEENGDFYNSLCFATNAYPTFDIEYIASLSPCQLVIDIDPPYNLIIL